MLYFDHTYTNDPRHRFLKRLEKLGFNLDEKGVEHPGRQFCRFIMFPKPSSPRKCTYLEFVNVKPGGDAITKPGISLGYSKALKSVIDNPQTAKKAALLISMWIEGKERKRKKAG